MRELTGGGGEEGGIGIVLKYFLVVIENDGNDLRGAGGAVCFVAVVSTRRGFECMNDVVEISKFHLLGLYRVYYHVSRSSGVLVDHLVL